MLICNKEAEKKILKNSSSFYAIDRTTTLIYCFVIFTDWLANER